MLKTAIIILLLFTSSLSLAAELTLSWDTIPDATGYKIVYGTSYNNLDQEIDAGLGQEESINRRKYSVDNLTLGSVYFFKIKGYNGTVESELSNGAFGVAKMKTTSLSVQ